MTAPPPPARSEREFPRGFRAVVPLWLGMVPFGVAYAVTARAAGLTPLETQLMSLLVFAGGAQFSAAGLFAAGAAGPAIVLTTFLLNARHLLYGLSLGRRVRLGGWRRLVAAHLLTDEAYGVTMNEPAPSVSFLLGAEASVFVSWNLATLAGAQLGAAVTDPTALGVDFVFPLAFLALLVPQLRGGAELAVALASALVALAASRLVGGGLATLAAGVLGAALGAALTRGER